MTRADAHKTMDPIERLEGKIDYCINQTKMIAQQYEDAKERETERTNRVEKLTDACTTLHSSVVQLTGQMKEHDDKLWDEDNGVLFQLDRIKQAKANEDKLKSDRLKIWAIAISVAALVSSIVITIITSHG